MRLILVALIVTCAILTANSARAADPFDPFRPPTIGEMIVRNVEEVINAAQKFREAGAQANQEMEAARKAFWSQYPNGPRHAATQEAFANALLAKDLYYLSLAAQERCNGPAQTVLDKLSKLDGGIPTDAYLAFCEWVEAVRAQLGVRAGQSLPFDAIGKVIPTALRLEQFDRYKQARDWSEFARAGKVPYRSWGDLEKSKDPQLYAYVLLEVSSTLVGNSFPVQLQKTAERFKFLADKHGNNTMLSMAEKIMRAPRGTTTAIGKPDQIVPDPDRMAQAEDLRKAGWNDAQASICSGRFIFNCYDTLIGEMEPASPAPIPPLSKGAPGRAGRGGAAGSSVSRPERSTTGGSAVGAGSTATQPNRTVADQARADACDQNIAIMKELGANKYGERVAAESARNQEFFEYTRELQKQQLPMAERQKRLTEKQQALQESYRLKINALDQKKAQLEEQLRQAERTCAGSSAVPTSPSAAQSGGRAPQPQPPAPAGPPDILTNGSGPSTVPPNTSAGSTTAQTNRSAADQARAEACDQRSVIQAQMAATNRERIEAERKMNPELSAYRRELAQQHVPAAEAAKRYNAKQEALKGSYGVTAFEQRTKQLGEQLQQAQANCVASLATPTSPSAPQSQPRPAQSNQASSLPDPTEFARQQLEILAQAPGGRAPRPQPPALLPAVPSNAAAKQLSSRDISGIKAAVGWPVDVNGTVSRVEQHETFRDSGSVFTKIFFAESPDVFVYVIPTFTPKIAALRGNLAGQKISVHLDRLYPTTSGPIELRIERPEDLSVGDRRPSPVQPTVAIGASPGPGRSPTTGVPAQGDPTKAREAVYARTRTIIAEQLGPDLTEIKPGTRLIEDLGADELDLVEIVFAIEEEFVFEMSAEEEAMIECEPAVAAKHACLSTVDQIANFLFKKVQTK